MKDKIKATIFIPTWYGDKYLKELFQMVFSQETDFMYEVLVYDTSSKDKTPEIIKKYAKKHKNLRYKTITKDQFGHGKTRQAAAEDAKGEIVVYLSQDATPASTKWLYEMVKPFEISTKIVAVLGKQVPRSNAFPLLKYEILSVFNNFGPEMGTTLYYDDSFVDHQSIHDHISFYSDVNSATRREFLLNEIPYRDVPYSEDQLFGREIINAGYIKAYSARGAVIHANDMRLNEYKNRIFDETMGLRKIGLRVGAPSKKATLKLIARGIAKDTFRIFRDHDYSTKRKLFWLLVNPLFHIEKWRGVRAAATADLDDDEKFKKYSLESIRDTKFNR